MAAPMISNDSLRPAPLLPSRNPTRVTSKAEPSISPSPDLEAQRPPPSPRHHPLIPGFNNPPPFLTFLHHSWYDIATQFLCLITAFLLYKFCPPIMPRLFPLYPGIETSSWGLKYGQPYLKEYIDTNVSAIVSFFGPAAVMGGIALWGTRRFEDGNAALIGLGYALSTSTLFQLLIKIFIGGLRPHFLSICNPKLPPISPGIPTWKASEVHFFTPAQVCTADAKTIKEAQMSFPSGHASAAFAGYGFLALFLNAKYKVLSSGGHFRQDHGSERQLGRLGVSDETTQRVHHWKLVLFVFPWSIAFVMALSKVRDGWHHPVDVIFGALVGTVFAHMAYKMVYRSVYDERTNHLPLGGGSGERVRLGDEAPKEA